MPEMLNFGSAPRPVKKVLEITSFAGVDLSSAPADINRKRSPDAPNMIPDSKGNPMKRTGFALFESFEGRINGAFKLGEHRIIHAGDSLFIDGEKKWEGMANEISTGQIIKDALYIFDGFEALVCDGNDAWPLSEKAYIPTVLISKNADFAERETVLKGDGLTKEFTLEHRPLRIISVESTGETASATIDGDRVVFDAAPAEGEEVSVKAYCAQAPGGAIKEEFNLISSRWKESFLCDTGTESVFSLSKEGLSEGAVRAWVMDDSGSWNEKTEDVDFTVDRETGKITFSQPVGRTPIIGTDNLIIEAAKYFEGYEDRINRCRQSITYDAAGTSNRIFLSGNPAEPRRDHWCAAGDPTYWPDTYYSEIGNGGSRILGYSIINNYLATYISEPVDGRAVVIRSAEIDDGGNVSFPIRNHLLGQEAICPRGFIFADREQLFLTARGVYAITTEDISGEKYTQNRSYYINKALIEEELSKAFCAKWKQFFCIAVGGKIYLLDTSQKSYERGEPQTTFQYECYLWTGIDARILWEDGGKLWFGDENGRVFYFTDNVFSDWSDEGEKAIEAHWTFPDFGGDYFFRNKTVRMVAIQAAPYPQNKIQLEYRTGHIWNVLKEWSAKLSFFGWSGLSWENFTWSGNFVYRTITAKVKIKKFDKVGFRVSCNDLNKAFGLYGFALEYTENGRYKK